MRKKHKRDQRNGVRSQRGCTCGWCISNKTHHNAKREPIIEKL